MYINSLRQHIIISGITVLVTVWIFLLLARVFEKQAEQDYPALAQGDIFIDKKLIDERAVDGKTEDILRQVVMQQFIQSGYTGFVAKPYDISSNDVHITTRDNQFTGDLIVESLPAEPDHLDQYINTFLAGYNDTEYQIHKKPFHLKPAEYDTWTGLHLFRSVQDLYDMGYQVVSHRARINKDAGYRRHNISTAFKEFGNVRVILPGEEVSFLEEINFDPIERELYKQGFTVVLDEDQTEYGGGLCGASTALYQGLLTNTAIKPAERRVHTQRRSDLYNAEVNGEYISTPGLDSTIYDGHIDYKIENTAPYPIILVANYDGERGGVEEVFSLAKAEQKGSLEYDFHYGGCYTRVINGEERLSCYKQINGK